MADSAVMQRANASITKTNRTQSLHLDGPRPRRERSLSTGEGRALRARIADYSTLLAGLRSPSRMSHRLDERRPPPQDLASRAPAAVAAAADRQEIDDAGQLPSLLSVLAATPAMTGCGGGPRAQVDVTVAPTESATATAAAPSPPQPTITSPPAATVVASKPVRTLNDDRFVLRHQAQASVLTSASTDSTDSSPTTTISTVDSSSVTDESPESSPESPVSSLPLAVVGRCSKAPPPLQSPPPPPPPPSPPPPPPAPRPADEPSLVPPPGPFFGQNGPLSPGRRPRNTKNLSLNMSAPTRQLAPPPTLRIKTASAADTLQSAPPTPSVPATGTHPPRKRPGHLGLSVHTTTIAALPPPPPPPSGAASNRSRGVPQSPLTSRPNTLRHHQSSPSLSLFSPTMGVPGGMQLPPFNPRHHMAPSSQRQQQQQQQQQQQPPPSPLPEGLQSRSLQPDPSKSGPCFSGRTSPARLEELEEESEEDYGVPLSQEAKSPAYPSGPVCIYEPHVYLYLEPSDHEASQFDVIVNVAREVKNPFVDGPASGPGQASFCSTASSFRTCSGDSTVSDGAAAAAAAAAPGTILDSDPVCSPVAGALEGPPRSFEARPAAQGPEYIHVPWDHNSNIVDDMLRLVEVIDDRVRQGKRVLVHCQCGVSRSASLIVAYGLYRDPSLTVQEVYDAVKHKSRWIGPNMSLIYQLSEFRTKLVQRRGLATSGLRHHWRGAGGGTVGGSTASGRANTLPGGIISDPALFGMGPFEARRSAPQTAPLPGEHERASGRSSPCGALKTEGYASIAPGPSSAPSGVAWESQPSLIIAGGVPADARDTVERSDPDPSSRSRVAPPPLPPLRPSLPAAAREAPSLEPTNVAGKDDPPEPGDETESMSVPPTPALMSPRVASFTANPLHEPSLSPAMSKGTSTLGFRHMIAIDPRSPAQHGEAPIVRSIFDVL